MSYGRVSSVKVCFGSQVPVRYVMDGLGAFCRGAVWYGSFGMVGPGDVWQGTVLRGTVRQSW